MNQHLAFAKSKIAAMLNYTDGSEEAKKKLVEALKLIDEAMILQEEFVQKRHKESIMVM